MANIMDSLSSINRVLKSYDNPAFQTAMRISEMIPVHRFSTMMTVAPEWALHSNALLQIQPRIAEINRVMLQHQRTLEALNLPMNRMTEISASINAISSTMSRINASLNISPQALQVTVPSRRFQEMHRQLEVITQLPEWGMIQDKIGPSIDIDEFVKGRDPETQPEYKLKPKRRHRMILRAKSQRRSLSLLECIGLVGSLITIYEFVKDVEIRQAIINFLQMLTAMIDRNLPH